MSTGIYRPVAGGESLSGFLNRIGTQSRTVRGRAKPGKGVDMSGGAGVPATTNPNDESDRVGGHEPVPIDSSQVPERDREDLLADHADRPIPADDDFERWLAQQDISFFCKIPTLLTLFGTAGMALAAYVNHEFGNFNHMGLIFAAGTAACGALSVYKLLVCKSEEDWKAIYNSVNKPDVNN